MRTPTRLWGSLPRRLIHPSWRLNKSLVQVMEKIWLTRGWNTARVKWFLNTSRCLILLPDININPTPQESSGRCAVEIWSCRAKGKCSWPLKRSSRATRKSRGGTSWARPASWASSTIPTSSTWREWSPRAVPSWSSPSSWRMDLWTPSSE